MKHIFQFYQFFPCVTFFLLCNFQNSNFIWSAAAYDNRSGGFSGIKIIASFPLATSYNCDNVYFQIWSNFRRKEKIAVSDILWENSSIWYSLHLNTLFHMFFMCSLNQTFFGTIYCFVNYNMFSLSILRYLNWAPTIWSITTSLFIIYFRFWWYLE